MKNTRIILMLLAALLAFSLLAACGKQDTEQDDQSADGQTELYATIDVYSMTCELAYTETDADGQSYESSSMSVAFAVKGGQTIREALDASGFKDLKVKGDGDTLEGWIAYKENTYTDSDGFAWPYYERISETLLTDEEMFGATLTDCNMTYVAKWQSISDAEYADMYESSGITDSGFEPEYSLSLLANGGTIYTGESEPYDDIAMGGYTFGAGKTLGEVIDKKIAKAEKDGATFIGWTVYSAEDYTIVNEEPKNLADNQMSIYLGSELYGYQVLTNYALCAENATTDEMTAIVTESLHYFVTANWK